MDRIRAFVIEDSPIILQGLTEALEEQARVRVVGSAGDEAEALRWLSSCARDCDVVIVDIFLKSGSGLGVLQGLRRIKAEGHGPQSVVVTNYATPDMRARCFALGADLVFDKSNEIEEMLAWFASLRRAEERSH